jgi:Flp pilus assembly protein TadD
MNKKQNQLLSLANHYFKNKNFNYAEKILNQVIVESPKNSRANELLGYIYGNQGKLETAFDKLKIACQQKECSPEAIYYLGTFYLKNNDLHKAITLFKDAVNKGGNFFLWDADMNICQGQKS